MGKLRTEIWLWRNLSSRKIKSMLVTRKENLKENRNFVFHILAINNTEYYQAAELCIKSLSQYINNPAVILHTDRNGEIFFEKIVSNLSKVCSLQIEVFTKEDTWQESKIRIILKELGQNGVFLDADLYWNGIIPAFTKTTFYVKEIGRLKDNPYRQAIESTFPLLKSSDMINTSLVFLGELSGNLYFENILTQAFEKILDFAKTADLGDQPSQKLIRLAEQLAITIAVHSTLSDFQTLKSSDSPFDRGIVESYYLGTTRNWG